MFQVLVTKKFKSLSFLVTNNFYFKKLLFHFKYHILEIKQCQNHISYLYSFFFIKKIYNCILYGIFHKDIFFTKNKKL